MAKYHLGCGRYYKKGYVNIDFPDNEHTVMDVKADRYEDIRTMRFFELADEIYSRHVFEHFGYVDAMSLLIKWTNITNDGGKIIIDIPDVKRIAEMISSPDVKCQGAVIRLLYGSQEAEWAYHISGWTEDILSSVMFDLGHDLIKSRQYGKDNSIFPNYGIEFTFHKRVSMSLSELIERGREKMSLFVNLPVEEKLFNILGNELKNKITEFGCEEDMRCCFQ